MKKKILTKKIKFLISGILSFIIVGTGTYFCSLLPKSENNNYRRYLWVFRDTAQKNVDPMISFGEVGEEDIEYSYIYNNDYFVEVWEFLSLKGSTLNNISIIENIDLSKDKIPFSIVNHSNRKKNPIITRKLGFVFENKMNVLVSDNSNIIKKINSKNYKGFIGNIDRVCLSDGKDNHLVSMDWPSKNELTLFLLCKKNDRFYIIIVNSNLVFNESIIDIFDLN